jgi:pimeloyl-ACP methyl ester carboxylesterase
LNSAILLHQADECVRQSVHSADGTRIAFTRVGSGPAVVFVHGSLSVGADWLGIAQHLAPRFTCFLMDRRGYGHSERGSSAYSIEQEYEDVSAVLAAAGPGAALAGHSYGAICALGAALRSPVRRLVAYEPPLPVAGPIAGEHFAPFAAAVAEGHYDDALALGLRNFVRLPAARVHTMRSSRGWPLLAARIPAWERELRAMDAFSASVDAFAAIDCPTLLLLGSESSAHPFHHATAALHRTLPHVQLIGLDGLNHMALRSSRELLAQHFGQFLSA